MSPDHVARAFLNAIAKREWRTAADLVDADFISRVLKPFCAPNPRASGVSEADDSDDDAIPFLFPGVSSRQELAALAEHEAFALCLAGWASSGGLAEARPRPRKLQRIVGALVTEDRAHVVYYARWYESDVAVPRVLVLRRSDQGWRVLPTTDVVASPPETHFAEPFVDEW